MAFQPTAVFKPLTSTALQQMASMITQQHGHTKHKIQARLYQPFKRSNEQSSEFEGTLPVSPGSSQDVEGCIEGSSSQNRCLPSVFLAVQQQQL